MNATLVNLVDPENPESLKPMIDGGTEGWLGTHTRFCDLDFTTLQVLRGKPV